MPTSARADCTDFYGNLRRIRNFPVGRQSRRPLQQLFALLVGADGSVRPQVVPLFTEICGESVTSQRADVGIGPYNCRHSCTRIRHNLSKNQPVPLGGQSRPPLQERYHSVPLPRDARQGPLSALWRNGIRDAAHSDGRKLVQIDDLREQPCILYLVALPAAGVGAVP